MQTTKIVSRLVRSLGTNDPDVYDPIALGINIPRVNLDEDHQLSELYWTNIGARSHKPNSGELAWA